MANNSSFGGVSRTCKIPHVHTECDELVDWGHIPTANLHDRLIEVP